MKGKGAFRVSVALLLALVVGTMLWLSSPVRALTVDISDTTGDTLSQDIEFSIEVYIEDTGELPLQGVDLLITNDSDPSYGVICEDLPLTDGGHEEYDFTGDTPAGGTVTVDTTEDELSAYGYGYGYGYGSSAYLIYDITWGSPGNWPAGDYTIEAQVTAADDEIFYQTRTVYLNRVVTGGVGGGGGGDKNPPRISEVLVDGVTMTSVDVHWKTQERSTSQVEYWASAHKFSELDEERVITHLVTLTDLKPGTTYNYKVLSEDASGNKGESEKLSFVTDGEPANIAVESVEITPDEIMVGEQVTVSVTVRNTGDARGDFTVTLQIDGEVTDSQEVVLSGGSKKTVTFTITGEESRTYNVGVNGVFAAFSVAAETTSAPIPTPAVPAPAVPEKPDEPSVNWWLIGGIIAGLVAVVMIVWMTVVRRRP